MRILGSSVITGILSLSVRVRPGRVRRRRSVVDIESRAKPNAVGKALYVLRRWPVIPILIIGTLVVCAVFAESVSPSEPNRQALLSRTAAPSWYPVCSVNEKPYLTDVCSRGTKYLIGADALGRDILTRIIHGARISLTLATISIGVGMLIGTALGLAAGYLGEVVDEVIMRFTDVVTAIPYLLLALIIVTVLGQKYWVIVGVLALASWPEIVRLVRGQTLQLRTLDYVSLAKVSGASTPRIVFRHILPGVMNTLVVATTLQVGGIILAESILGYLGAGVPAPTPAWGSDVAHGRDYLGSAWWVAFFPGMAIFLTVLSFNFIGDWLRDRWDPRLRQVG